MNSNTSQRRIKGLNGFSQTLTTGIDRTCHLCLWSVVGPEKRKNAGGQDSKEEARGSNVMSVFEKSRGVCRSHSSNEILVCSQICPQRQNTLRSLLTSSLLRYTPVVCYLVGVGFWGQLFLLTRHLHCVCWVTEMLCVFVYIWLVLLGAAGFFIFFVCKL